MGLNVAHGAPHHIFDPAAGGGGGGGGGTFGCALFNANEDLDLYSIAPAPGTFDKNASFDGIRESIGAGNLHQLVMWQMDDGTAGVTTVEVYRRRAGVFNPPTPIATLSLAAGGGDFARVLVVPAPNDLVAGDVIVCQFTSVQTAGRNVTVEIYCLGDGGGCWVEDTFTTLAGQTIFNLSSSPCDPDSVFFVANGATYRRNLHYTLAGSTITWLNQAFVFPAGMDVSIKYVA